MLPKESLDEIFILYPDPWPKSRHEKRRIINKENLDLLLSILKINGILHLATDAENYFHSIRVLFENCLETQIINSDNYNIRPDNIISTRYEKKASENERIPSYMEVKKILAKNKKVS